jgi:hypothetical protein
MNPALSEHEAEMLITTPQLWATITYTEKRSGSRDHSADMGVTETAGLFQLNYY